MKINTGLLVRLRTERSWSQDELAISSGLNLRTVQRIEKEGSASLQSKKALAGALDIDPRDLDAEVKAMHACVVCRSTDVYQAKAAFSMSSDDLLPGLGSAFLSAKIRPSICLNCGNVQLFAAESAREKAPTSKHWKAVSGDSTE
jgi:transcriptional regulator with XRE-family HTH domain